MKASKHKGGATELEGDVGSSPGNALNGAGMARRSFLGCIARWSAALAAFGVGPEALMQAVSGRSIMSSALAAGATRDRQLHPFPSDDPFNLPLGANAVLMPENDSTTLLFKCMNHAGTGWGRAIHKTTSADPMHLVKLGRTDAPPHRNGVLSYVPEEHGKWEISYRIPDGANPQVPSDHNWGDRRFIMVRGNDIWEAHKVCRADIDGRVQSDGSLCAETAARAHPRVFASRKVVRNRSGRYSYGTHSHPDWNWPDRNVAAGGSAWNGSSIAGVIRREELEGNNPHIPHAMVFNLIRWYQITGYEQGDPSSPLHNRAFLFPATANDRGTGLTGQYNTYIVNAFSVPSWTTGVAVQRGDLRSHNGIHWTCYQSHTTSASFTPGSAPTHWGGGSARMGMRVALDPTVFTDAYINSIESSPRRRAIVRAARDYGVIICDETRGRCMQFQCDITVGNTILNEVRGNHEWWTSRLRRVVGRMTPGGPLVHVPHYQEWRAWADAGRGWGGGAPRVPYSPPLAPL